MEISPGFLVLTAWLNYMDHQGLFLPGIISCFLHECGHLAVLHFLKKPVKMIRLTVFGAEICMARSLSYREEILAACMGPAVNLVLAGVLCRVPGMEAVAGLNLVLACFNLLPIGSLDGGRVLCCLLCLLLGTEYGDTVFHRISCLAACLVCGGGILVLGIGGNLTLLLTSVWLLRRVSKKGCSTGRKSRK